jgi:SAM-dependent methyltransferase
VSSPTIWSSGRYDAVGERIAPIADAVVAAVDRRAPLRDAALIDLACGTGNVALAAEAAGARVTAVDLTPELIAIGAQKDTAQSITWVTADASDTGLPGGSFDACASNMGIIFVDPDPLVAEVARLLKPAGVLGFSSWVRDPDNPFFSPIVAVLGPPPQEGYSPDQWGQSDVIRDRLALHFDDIEIEHGTLTWQLGSVHDAVHFITDESPMHVSVLANLDAGTRERLVAAFSETMRTHAGADGNVTYDAPYAMVTALRR